MSKLEIINKLLEFDVILHEKEVDFVKRGYSDIIEANKLLQNNPNAFLIGVIFDQGITAEKAWSAPFLLKQRLGHFDVFKINKMDKEDLVRICIKKPALHRFHYLGRWVHEATETLIKKYGGDAKNIWSGNQNASEVVKQLQKFKGIGQKKSNMATLLLYRDLKVPLKNMKGIDIAYDVHIRRVLLRTGIAKEDNLKHMVNTIRKINPEFPARVDGPLWHVGRNWCHSQKPDCINCFLNIICPKLITKNIK